MLKITGLDNLQKELEDAQRALQSLDGHLTTVKYDPNNAESVNAAIREMEAAVDAKVAPYRGNPLVESIVPELKEKYRAAILERAG